MTRIDPVTDPMTALRAADPVARIDRTGLDSATHQASAALREGILLTERSGDCDQDGAQPVPIPASPCRTPRRLAIAGGLAVALVGSGAAAYAVYDTWYRGMSDGVTCMTQWVDPGDYTGPHDGITGGPAITHDPIADCQRYQQLTGNPPIEDPVAVAPEGTGAVYGGTNDMIFVAPADEVPEGYAPVEPATDRHQAMVRLHNSLMDYVDGGYSRCFDTESGLAFARAEAGRLGLSDISITEQDLTGTGTLKEGPCGWFVIDVPEERVMFSPERLSADEFEGPKSPIIEGLRSEVADTCVSLPDAEQIAARLLDGSHHWPTSAIVDETLECTTVDLVMGGSTQVFLRGPEVARP